MPEKLAKWGGVMELDLEGIREEIGKINGCLTSISDEMAEKGGSAYWMPFLLGSISVHVDRVEKMLRDEA
jgi:hypothetical protein